MKFILKNKAIFFFSLAAIVLVVVLLSFFYNTQKVRLISKMVEHTQDVLRKSDDVFLDVLNIESSSRSYILTGNSDYLKPYNRATKTIDSKIDELNKLTNDNKQQHSRIISLKNVVDEKVIFTKKNIEARKQNELSQKEKIDANENGKILTDKIRSIISYINTEEFRLLDHRKKEKSNINENSNDIFILLFIVIGFIIAFVIFIIKNQRAKDKFADELKKSNDLFSSLFSYNPASIYIRSVKDDKILNVNLSFLLLYGFTSEKEVIGKTTKELNLFINPNRDKEIEQLLKEENMVKDFETEIKTTNGDIKWTSDSILLLEVNNEPCLFSVSIDTTHRKIAEDQLQITNKELEAFTYSVSHDLRAPLRAINGYAAILQEDFSNILNNEGIQSLQAIMKNSKKMGELIDDLLAFSRLGRKVVATSEINMTGLVKTVREEVMLGNKGNIEFNISELLPAMGQQALIKQVWVNLISNAVKFSEHNSKSFIEIGSYIEDNHITYFVKDNGAGFDMKYYDKLFGVFQRLHSQEEFEGTGIGLAIVQKIIQRHNGKVWAESKLNEGSCFNFSLSNINS